MLEPFHGRRHSVYYDRCAELTERQYHEQLTDSANGTATFVVCSRGRSSSLIAFKVTFYDTFEES